MADLFYKLTGPLAPSTPREMIPFLYTIRKESEWSGLGFKIIKDKFGNCKPFSRKRMWFKFREKQDLDEVERLAAATGKRCVSDPKSIALFRMFGCQYDEFIELPEAVKMYCEAFLEEHKDLVPGASKR